VDRKIEGFPGTRRTTDDDPHPRKSRRGNDRVSLKPLEWIEEANALAFLEAVNLHDITRRVFWEKEFTLCE
jgi:hypothetical protein